MSDAAHQHRTCKPMGFVATVTAVYQLSVVLYTCIVSGSILYVLCMLHVLLLKVEYKTTNIRQWFYTVYTST